MANEITQMQPVKAAEILSKMIGQLEIVIDHFKDQKDISTDTKQRTLTDMNDQLEAMKHGKAAIEHCISDGSVIVVRNDNA